jgi:hypothetical protein
MAFQLMAACGNDIRQCLHRRPLWNKLRQEYEAKGEKLVPYSCRHGYAHLHVLASSAPPWPRCKRCSQVIHAKLLVLKESEQTLQDLHQGKSIVAGNHRDAMAQEPPAA